MLNTDPNHRHVYDKNGKRVCCTLEEKIYLEAKVKPAWNGHEDHVSHSHDHGESSEKQSSKYFPVAFSFSALMLGLILDHQLKVDFFKGYVRAVYYGVCYLPVGYPVMKEAAKAIFKKAFFTEFTLMTIATAGAFAIGEYPEGVAVMVFYALGELFQSSAISRAQSSIKALLDIRPNRASVFRNGIYESVLPENVNIGETIQVKSGEKIPLDGTLSTERSSFNTAALTGESRPKSIEKGESVLAGMINLDKLIDIEVTKKFADSSLARILEMVQNAASRKAPTELFIRKFAKVYTPIVFVLAVALVFAPYFVMGGNYDFKVWLYRSLVFLVISCPCALVISIPLGYFGGIGTASRHGILFKGSNYLDVMTKVNTVVMDKTGTLTEGVFKVQDVVVGAGDKESFLKIVASLEKKSTHPIAKAIVNSQGLKANLVEAENVEEISGHGLSGEVGGQKVLAGNSKLLKKYNINYPQEVDSVVDSIVVAAINGVYAGYITIADSIKVDSPNAIAQLHEYKIKTVMLSGDKDSVTQNVARKIGIDTAFGSLLPEDKVKHLEDLKKNKGNVIAFVGDGINDAPVLALSDVGIAMGGMGSDAAIETANVVIQTDEPSKIVTAIMIAKGTRSVVLQNITLAFAVKIVVLALGAGGLATMWEAVFADVGVALLAILNAVRIQKMNFTSKT